MNRHSAVFALMPLLASILAAQPPALSTADYARAEKFMTYNTTPLVWDAVTRPVWLPGDRFWYRTNTSNGTEFVLVDAASSTRRALFDQARLASGLSKVFGRAVETYRLPFTDFEAGPDLSDIRFASGDKRFRCRLTDYVCEADASPDRRNESVSPDGKRSVFIRDFNLWVRDTSTPKETRLTSDGVQDFGYATDNAGWVKSDRPVVVWSPDSTRIATFQHDGRGVGEMYLADTKVGHPTLQAWKYPLPGDDKIFMIERVVIDVNTGSVTRLKIPPDPHRSSLCDHVVCGGVWADVQWSTDGRQLAFLSTSRDHRHQTLRVADPSTGAVRDVFEEKVATFFESGNGRVNWRLLAASNEFIWFSQRENWGHLYLYDLSTGKLKNAITSGEGNVTQLLRVDEKARSAYFLGVGKEKNRDPYFIHFYRIGLDGRSLELLTKEDATHEIALAPSGAYFVDTYSKPDTPPVTLLRELDGRTRMTVGAADVSKLREAGWIPPTPIKVKARDGVTDLYGLMYRPTRFDPSRRYPIINNVYPGPQTGSVGSRVFSPSRGDAQAIAELGFVVVQIDGMGTPWRSKRFHEAYYGNMGDNTLPDQVAGMKELASRYPWIDIGRAGIYGHSGGGYATAGAMFRYPDFFKVGVSQAGNHDNRNYEDDWAEKWQGLLIREANGTTNYDDQANQNFAKDLKGKLLLAHGTMDANVPVYNTLLVVNELIRHNKDFDLILLPNRGHGFGNEPYMVRRRWDYFVRHLLGAEPPIGYELKPPSP